nr:MAG TPA: hypothetical protein [Bacteriophage sp.]
MRKLLFNLTKARYILINGVQKGSCDGKKI